MTGDRAAYEELVPRVAALLGECLPAGANALVVSHGDERLVTAPGRTLGHFPQTPTGLYAGHHPADGRAALDHLLALRAAGCGHLVIPAPYRWWLDHYRELADWLAADAAIVADAPAVATVFALIAPAATAPARTGSSIAPQIAALLTALLPADAGVLLVGPDVEQVELGERPRWVLAPETMVAGPPPTGALARAIDAGAEYAALALAPDPLRTPDARLRRALRDRGRLVCAQRLLEVYALAPGARS